MPEVISRRAAIQAGQNKYFTGEPCKNGHIALRYIQSGTCEECIRGATPSPQTDPERLKIQQQRVDIEAAKLKLRQDRLALDQQRVALRVQRAAIKPKLDLVPIRIMLHYADVDFFKSIMLARTWEHDGSLTLADLSTNKPPVTAGARTIYTFKVFQSDFEWLHEKAREIDSERRKRPDDEDEIYYRQRQQQIAQEALRDVESQ